MDDGVPPLPPGFALDTTETRPHPASLFEKTVGSGAGRFALGAASPLLASAQGGAHIGDWLNRQMGVEPVVSPWMDKQLQELEFAKARGRQSYGNEGYDWWGLAGQLAPSSAIANRVTSALPHATQLLPRMGMGAASGAAMGAASPVTEPGDFAAQKGAQALAGGAVGGAIPLVGDTASKGSKIVSNLSSPILDLFRQSGPQNFLTRYLREIIGAQNVPKIQSALANVKELVPGSKPTASQAVAGMPEGSPLQAYEKITAGTSGGPSALFGQRKMEQEAAQHMAETARDLSTKPMRDAALNAANTSGGVSTPKLLAGIADLEARPGFRASDVISKSLAHVREKIGSLAGNRLKIDAHDLYTVRKEIGNTIKKYSKETANWDKRLTAGLQGDVKKLIDDAIESSGGTGWKQYIKLYADLTKSIEQDVERIAMASKPIQRTNLTGGVNVSKEVMPHLPSLLSRPVVVANWLLGKVGKGSIEPKIDALAADLFRNPQALGQAIQGQAPMLTLQQQRLLGSIAALAQIAGPTAIGRTQP